MRGIESLPSVCEEGDLKLKSCMGFTLYSKYLILDLLYYIVYIIYYILLIMYSDVEFVSRALFSLALGSSDLSRSGLQGPPAARIGLLTGGWQAGGTNKRAACDCAFCFGGDLKQT